MATESSRVPALSSSVGHPAALLLHQALDALVAPRSGIRPWYRPGLHSIPRYCGIGKALWIARLLHLSMLFLLAALVWVFGLGTFAVLGVVAVLALLAYEHSLVSARDLTKLNAAFFTMNGIIAVVFFVFLAADLLLRAHPS